MRDEEPQWPQTTPSSSSSSGSISVSRREGPSSVEALFGRGGRYKLWAFTAILLLALWSMLTGWSAVNLNHPSPHLHSPAPPDLDVLDVDEREKLVRQMWNAYKHSSVVHLPSFWRDAFGAAYQDLTSEIASIRNAALLEIAKLSFGLGDVYDDPPPGESAAKQSLL